MTGKKHLFVLVHGLWGTHSHMNAVKTAFSEALGDDAVFYVPRSNGYVKTLHGIELVGYQTVVELTEFVQARDPHTFDRISFIGYSMGGLVSRFVIGTIFTECRVVFGHMKPVLFMTFATPHLGVQFYQPRNPRAKSTVMGAVLPVARFVGSHFLGRSGRQLFLAYEHDDTLVRMTEGVYLEQLARFRHRVCFANVKNDRTVAFYTSFITDCDPFLETNNQLLYKFDASLPTQEDPAVCPRVLDLAALDPVKSAPAHAKKWHLVAMWLMLLLPFSFTLLPLVFFVNVLATMYSYVVTLTEQSWISRGDGHRIIRRRLKLADGLNETVREAVGDIVNADFAPEPAQQVAPPETSDQGMSWGKFVSKYSTNRPASGRFPRLPFDAKRKQMLHNLDSLSWIRVPVYIRAFNAHDGIVARQGLKRSSESAVASVRFAAQLARHLVSDA
ncbi:AaceriADR202Cp [[Ashbya] aceris (nom. inval.)]|nr:AaceriADR202Cp [[Ashbya] aceris (nom. inval.)]